MIYIHGDVQQLRNRHMDGRNERIAAAILSVTQKVFDF